MPRRTRGSGGQGPMTGGVVYMRIQAELGMDLAAVERRLAKGAVVAIVDKLDGTDENNLAELLGGYADALDDGNQPEEAAEVRELAVAPHGQFAKVIARNQQVDPSVSTEEQGIPAQIQDWRQTAPSESGIPLKGPGTRPRDP